MSSTTCHFTSDGFIPAGAQQTYRTYHVSAVLTHGHWLGYRVSCGVFAPDCVTAVHFLFRMQGETNFLVATCAPGRNLKYRILRFLESVFTTGPSNNLLGIVSAFSHKDESKRTGRGSCWIENFADLPKNEVKFSYLFGHP